MKNLVSLSRVGFLIFRNILKLRIFPIFLFLFSFAVLLLSMFMVNSCKIHEFDQKIMLPPGNYKVCTKNVENSIPLKYEQFCRVMIFMPIDTILLSLTDKFIVLNIEGGEVDFQSFRKVISGSKHLLYKAVNIKEINGGDVIIGMNRDISMFVIIGIILLLFYFGILFVLFQLE